LNKPGRLLSLDEHGTGQHARRCMNGRYQGSGLFFVLDSKVSGKIDIISGNPFMESINRHLRLKHEARPDTVAGMHS